jgi:hypothetical protein
MFRIGHGRIEARALYFLAAAKLRYRASVCPSAEKFRDSVATTAVKEITVSIRKLIVLRRELGSIRRGSF